MSNEKLVAIASLDNNCLDAEVSAHFGRCPFYTMVRVNGTEVLETWCESNTYAEHQPGIMPKFIKELGANVILAGGMGPKAVQMFNAFGIEVATGAVGTVHAVLKDYLGGDFTGVVPCSHNHPSSCGGHHA